MSKLRVKRKGYHRKAFVVHRNGKRIKMKATYVSPTTFTIKDRGRKGRGQKVIPVRKGKLAPYHISLPEAERHRILARKVKTYGALSVFRALNAQVVFRKRIQRNEKAIFKKDAEWVRSKWLGR